MTPFKEDPRKYHLRIQDGNGETIAFLPLFMLPLAPRMKSTEKPNPGIPGRAIYETDTDQFVFDTGEKWLAAGAAGAPTDASYVTITAEAGLSNETLHENIAAANRHPPKTHAASHESGGADEISVAGLLGDLADPQDPKTHAASHESGGTDEVLHDNLALDPTDHHTLPKTANQGTVTLGDTETFTIWRATLPAGKAIKVIDAGIQPSGTASLLIEVYNQTDAVSIYSNNVSYDDGSYGTPLASGGIGDDVEIRLNNGSGAVQDCSGWVTFVVE